MSPRVALLGGSVDHSISPSMQEAGFRALGLDWRYEARRVEEAHLEAAVRDLQGDGWLGANVTLPHKESVVDLLDSTDGQAADIGAVNTILAREGRLHGSNTDAPGLVNDLRQCGVVLEGTEAVILGAGGAARAAAWGLAEAGAPVRLIARTPGRVAGWRGRWGSAFGGELVAEAWTAAAFSRVAPGALIVNATPVGMWPDVAASPWPLEIPLPANSTVYDLVYRPRPTRLVKRARQAGLEAHTGLGMLVEQGALSLELWTGLQAPRAAMRSAAERALEVEIDQLSHRG